MRLVQSVSALGPVGPSPGEQSLGSLSVSAHRCLHWLRFVWVKDILNGIVCNSILNDIVHLFPHISLRPNAHPLHPATKRHHAQNPAMQHGPITKRKNSAMERGPITKRKSPAMEHGPITKRKNPAMEHGPSPNEKAPPWNMAPSPNEKAPPWNMAGSCTAGGLRHRRWKTYGGISGGGRPDRPPSRHGSAGARCRWESSSRRA